MMFVYVHPRQNLSRVSALTISVSCTCELALRLVSLIRGLAFCFVSLQLDMNLAISLCLF